MVEQKEPRLGSSCHMHCHAWRVTSMKGRYSCHVCRAVAYCPDCVRTIPLGSTVVRCEWHKQHKR